MNANGMSAHAARRGPWIVIAAFCVVATTVVSAAPPPPATVAVVDVMKLLDGHPRKKELNDRYDQRQQQARDWAKGENEALETLRGAIIIMNENEPPRRAKEKELGARLASVEFELKWRQQEAQREYLRGLDVLYGEVNAVVAKYARENGISVVLTKRDAADMRAGDINDWGLKVQLRTVVFHEGALDITEAIKRLLTAAPTVAPARNPGPPPAPAPVPPAGTGSPLPPPGQR